MELGWKELSLLKRVEERLAKLGYEMLYSKYNHGLNENSIGVRCKHDKHLLYARDAEVFSGNLHEVAGWLAGIEHHKSYLEMLNLISETKVHNAEQKKVSKIKNWALIQKIKDPDAKFDGRTNELLKSPP